MTNDASRPPVYFVGTQGGGAGPTPTTPPINSPSVWTVKKTDLGWCYFATIYRKSYSGKLWTGFSIDFPMSVYDEATDSNIGPDGQKLEEKITSSDYVVIRMGRILYAASKYLVTVLAPMYGLDAEKYKSKFLYKNVEEIESNEIWLPFAAFIFPLVITNPVPLEYLKGVSADGGTPDLREIIILGIIETLVLSILAIAGLKLGMEAVSIIFQMCNLGMKLYSSHAEKMWREDVVERLRRIEDYLKELSYDESKLDNFNNLGDKLDSLLANVGIKLAML